jgi:hypothetical protein
MKTWLFVGFFVVQVIGESGLSAVTRPEIDVPCVSGSFAIDGSAAEWAGVKSRGEGISFYKGDGRTGTSAKLGTTCLGTISHAADCRMDLWMAHDGTYLYILAEVLDDNYTSFGTGNTNDAYLEDTLHLYIDSTNAMKANIPGAPITTQPGYEQFGISTDGNIKGELTDFTSTGSARQPAPQGSSPDGTYWKAKCTVQQLAAQSYKYTFEERVTLAGRPGRNMSALVPGNHYGFDAEFCDADNGVQLQGWIFWSSNGFTDCYNSENLWGTMNLAVIPEPFTCLLLATGGLFAIRKRRQAKRVKN